MDLTGRVPSDGNGRLGELLFHSGRAAEAIEPWQAALELCRKINDVEGVLVYLGNLLEAFCYLEDLSDAIAAGEEAIQLHQAHGLDAGDLRKRIRRLREGELPCRIVCVHDNKEYELDELPDIEDCCGFGGTFSVKMPETSLAMGRAKVENIRKSGADVVVSPDISCLMHVDGIIRRDPAMKHVRSMHLAEVLVGE